nr:hypothetical protein [Paraburkholderia guartelaensis]
MMEVRKCVNEKSPLVPALIAAAAPSPALSERAWSPSPGRTILTTAKPVSMASVLTTSK